MDKIKYVCGFLFSPDFKHVVLIRKNRPEFQIGKCNGVGGKIEENETPSQAMKREFFEEAGLMVDDWKELAIISGNDWEVYFHYAISDKYLSVETKTDEIIEIHYVFNIPNIEVIPNLKWLIPMALDPNHIHCVATAN